MKNIFRVMCVLAILFNSVNAFSKTHWSEFRVTLLKGNDYRVGDNKRDVWTFEHAAATSWGDSFLFIDRLNSSDGSSSTYGEFSPRFKLATFDGFVKAIYFAPSVEMANGNNYLYGIGSNLDVPYFKFFQVNMYLRNNAVGDNSFQTTFAWGLPLGPLFYDGFIDIATGVKQTDQNGFETKSSTQMNFTSQLKYDIAPHLDYDNKLFVGIEYVFWNNKFGIKDSPEFRTDERNVNLLLKVHF